MLLRQPDFVTRSEQQVAQTSVESPLSGGEERSG